MTLRLLLVGTTLLTVAVTNGEANHGPEAATLKLGPVRALVISPHPDDATLGAGGLIQRVIHEGGTVRVIQMTGGDAFSNGVMTMKPGIRPTALSYRWYGSLREREAIRAMRQLGVSRAEIRLLGFPDEGLCVLASVNHRDSVFESPYTGRTAPPDAEQVVRGTLYRGDDVTRELTRLLDEFRPTLIVLPHAGDEHPDHCATHRLVHRALADAAATGRRPPRVLHYIVHYPKWLSVDGVDSRLEPASGAPRDEWSWRTLRLTAGELTAKRRALDTFRSQMLVMPRFLRTFERQSEIFAEGEPSQPMPCWCDAEDITRQTSGVR